MHLISKALLIGLSCGLFFGCCDQNSRSEKTKQQKQRVQSEKHKQRALHAKVCKLIQAQDVLKFFSLRYILSNSPADQSVISLSLKNNGEGNINICLPPWDPSMIAFEVSFMWKQQDGWIVCDGNPIVIFEDDLGIWIPVRPTIPPLTDPSEECYEWMPGQNDLNKCDRLYMIDSMSMDKIKWLLTSHIYDLGRYAKETNYGLRN